MDDLGGRRRQELLRQAQQCCRDLLAVEPIQQGLRRVARGLMQAEGRCLAIQIQLRRFVELHRRPFVPLAAVTGIVTIGQDAEEPGLEVGARLKRGVPAAGAQRCFLHEVLGVRPVAQQPQREPVRSPEQRLEQVVESLARGDGGLRARVVHQR